jgi:hypothetical protein
MQKAESCFVQESDRELVRAPMGEAAEGPRGKTGPGSIGPYLYDLFVSYRHDPVDRDWVRGRLVPALEEAGLRVCIDHRDFRLGVPLVLEIGRAVEQSHYTLAVLSPAYLESGFTELENVLAEHLGTERREQRLLLILHQDCKPRLGLRARLWLDMRDSHDFAPALARLVAELRSPEL